MTKQSRWIFSVETPGLVSLFKCQFDVKIYKRQIVFYMMKKEKIPKSVRNVLWSYDVQKIDLILHKKLIISQILNFGTKEATDWLFKTYEADEIRQIAQQIPLGQWEKKSLALWSFYLGIKPMTKSERVLNG